MLSFSESLEIPAGLLHDIHTAKTGGAGSIGALLRKNGFELSGKGRKATVWSHPNYPYVLKVFNDRAYSTFLTFTRNNQGNPYVPIIKGKPMVARDKPRLYIIRLEKLYPINRDDFDKFQDLWGELDGVDKNMDKLRNFLDRSRYDHDLESDNIMKRSNGHLVVTDPLSVEDYGGWGR